MAPTNDLPPQINIHPHLAFAYLNFLYFTTELMLEKKGKKETKSEEERTSMTVKLSAPISWDS